MADETKGTDVALSPEAKGEVEAIRSAGARSVAMQKELNATTKQLAGMRFGDVNGSTLSPETRYAIAQVCQLTGANPGLHLYILGGRPYLNAEFWSQTAASQPQNLGWDQENLAASNTAMIRKMAAEAEKDGDEEEAKELRRKARRLDMLRAEYGIPDTAGAAYETVIRRYSESAPMAAIRAGVVDPTPFIIEVREANWAGGKKGDPVGDARPGETARSRSLRRACVKAYATTLAPVERELRKLEETIEAEFTVLESDRRAPLPESGRQALSIGAGEPRAARAPEQEPAVEAPPVEVGTRVRSRKAEPQPETSEEDGPTRNARLRAQQALEMAGVVNVEAFALDKLGHEAASQQDWRRLEQLANGLLDGDGGGEGDEQGGLL